MNQRKFKPGTIRGVLAMAFGAAAFGTGAAGATGLGALLCVVALGLALSSMWATRNED